MSLKQFQAIILGCGGSGAVPNIGNDWGICNPDNSKNRRTRSSLAVLTPDKQSCVIDTGPDFVAQVNRENLPLPEFVMYSHYHADHIMGMDELRWISLKQKRQIPAYGSSETLEVLQSRVHYLFQSRRPDIYPSVLEAREINHFEMFETPFFDVLPIEMDHESCTATGFRIGNIAYCLDVKRLSDRSLDALKGVKTLIIDCSGNMGDTNKVHAGMPEILKWQETIQAKKIILSSLTPYMDYEKIHEETPDFMVPAFDGMQIDFQV